MEQSVTKADLAAISARIELVSELLDAVGDVVVAVAAEVCAASPEVRDRLMAGLEDAKANASDLSGTTSTKKAAIEAMMTVINERS